MWPASGPPPSTPLGIPPPAQPKSPPCSWPGAANGMCQLYEQWTPIPPPHSPSLFIWCSWMALPTFSSHPLKNGCGGSHAKLKEMFTLQGKEGSLSGTLQGRRNAGHGKERDTGQLLLHRTQTHTHNSIPAHPGLQSCCWSELGINNCLTRKGRLDKSMICLALVLL